MEGNIESLSTNNFTTRSTGQKKRGLVLAGGGAKGAYSFGCMEAFKERGIEFDAVAGTSVGALNAFLWSAEAMERGRQIWQNLSFASIYPIRILNPKYFNEHLIRTAAFPYVFTRLLWEAAKLTPVPAKKTFCILIVIITSIPIASQGWILHAIMPSVPLDQFKGIYYFSAMGPLMLLHVLTDEDGGLPLVYTIQIISFGALITYPILNHFFSLDVYFEGTTFNQYIAQPMFWLVLMVTQGLTFLLICNFLDKTLFSQRLSVLDSTPLKKQLEEVLEESELKIPIWATIASKKLIFDPDDPRWIIPTNDRGMVSPEGVCTPETTSRWCPEYIKLNGLPVKEAVDFCSASAALPFGIIPPISHENIEYVDGGIIDNCPLVPLLELSELDEIFIILLSPYGSDEEALLCERLSLNECNKRHRLKRLINYPLPKATTNPSRKNHVPSIVPNVLKDTQAKLIFFYPEESLGGVLSGTLNFSASYAKTLMELGNADAKKRLELLQSDDL